MSRHQINRGLIARMALAAVLLVGFVWAGSKLDWRLVGRQLHTASLTSELAMLACWIAALFIRPLRLLLLLRTFARQPGAHYSHVWSADMIAMAGNSVLPARAGDMTMAFVLRRGLDVPTTSLLSLVLVDRFFDFAVVVVIFVPALAFAPTIAPWASDVTQTLLVTLALLVAGLFVVIRFRAYWLVLCDRLLVRHERWRSFIHELLSGLAIIDKIGILLPVIVLSLFLWGATILSYKFAIGSIWPGAPLTAAGLAASAVALSSVIPLTPGGIGVFQATVVLVLSLFGVAAEPALAVAIMAHVTQLGAVLFFAVVAMARQGIGIRSLMAARTMR